MPYKDPTQQRKWASNYYQNNRGKFREYYLHNKEAIRTKQRVSERERRIRYRSELLESFSSICLVCGGNLSLGKKMYAFHEINGIDHSAQGSSVYLYVHEAGRFVPLCKNCHVMFHVLMNIGKTFEEILCFAGWKVI